MEFKYVYGIPNEEGYRLVKEKLISLGVEIHHSIHNDNAFNQYPIIGNHGDDWCGYRVANVHFKEVDGIHYDDFITPNGNWKEKLSELFNQKIKQNEIQISNNC